MPRVHADDPAIAGYGRALGAFPSSVGYPLAMIHETLSSPPAFLAGHALNAAALIGQIEASGHFADVKFAAPTTLGEEDKRESFTISGRIVPGRTIAR